MDMAFSIDNVFAAVAYTPNILLICTGVFIGIFAMRFIAQWFVSLMSKFPFLETSAFVVIALLGIKLFLSLFEHLYPNTYIAEILNGNFIDAIVSLITVIIFFMPLLTSIFFNIPKRNNNIIN
jgi:predicted tellurium resistance membrane protein TerC